MNRHWDRPVVLLVTLLLPIGLAGSACRQDRPVITTQETTITVENQTHEAWTNIEVWLNDHYRVTARSLDAGGRLVVPLDVFVAGFGQRFDRRRQSPFGIEATARTAAGREVRFVWGKGRRR
jgi:hypothetical protein